MPQEPSSKQRYPYTITGGIILLLATASVGAGFWLPFAAIDFRDEGFQSSATTEYYAMEAVVKDGGGSGNKDDETTMRYSDSVYDDGPGIAALRFGNYALVAGSFLVFCASMTMFAAPTSSLKTARAGGWLALTAAAAIVAAVAAFLSGYMEQGREFVRALGDGTIQVAGNRILAGTLFMGAGAVLAAGGGILGFSDKPKAPVMTSPPNPVA